MRQLDYYVAISIDGFIEGERGDISRFTAAGAGVDQYLQDLQGYDTVLMGRKTYEFGYQFGLQPGQLAYPHMDHYIISNTLQFEETDDRLHIIQPDRDMIIGLKQQSGGPIYLCGGGQTASWLLKNGLIDRLKIKLNPILLGAGTRLFGDSTLGQNFKLESVQTFDDGLIIASYGLRPA